MNERFLYFAYGSNLKSKRVKISSQSAELVGWAVLYGYRLAFAGKSKVFLFKSQKRIHSFYFYLLELEWRGCYDYPGS